MSSFPTSNDDFGVDFIHLTAETDDDSAPVSNAVRTSTTALPTTPIFDPPPSSVNGEVDEDDHKLRVEDSFHHDGDELGDANGNDPDSSYFTDNVRLNNLNVAAMDVEENGDTEGLSIQQQNTVPTPQQPELTMKEKLVLRERQRRIETERARLKRQFALSSNNEDSDNTDMVDGSSTRDHGNLDRRHLDFALDDDAGEDDANGTNHGQEFEEESTRAHPDEEEAVADEANRRLGFNMERFLRNSDSFNPEIESARAEIRPLETSGAATEATQGVVMERFLNELVDNANRVPNNLNDDNSGVGLERGEIARGEPLSEPHRSVSFDVDAMAQAPVATDSLLRGLDFHQEALLTSSHPSFGEESGAGLSLASNTSIRTEANTLRDDVYSVGDLPQYSTTSLDIMQEADDGSHDNVSSHVSDDEPRVLRLTEADMLEMAAIEEASIGNAPPSDRDEVESYSEVGELTDFGGSGGGMHRFLNDTSPDTPTTAVESTSQVSHRSERRGGTSAVSSSSATNDHTDADHVSDNLGIIEGISMSASDPTHYFVSPATASVAANPPSERGQDDDDDDVDVESQLIDTDGVNLNDHGGGDEPTVPLAFESEVVTRKMDGGGEERMNLGSETAGAATGNRQRRYNPADHGSIDESLDEPVQSNDIVDGFDFDKDAPRSPFLDCPVRVGLTNEDSFRNLPNDPWSSPGKMEISPLQVGGGNGRRLVIAAIGNGNTLQSIPLPTQHANYGTSSEGGSTLHALTRSTLDTETLPLLLSSSIPPEIVTRREFRNSEYSQDPEVILSGDDKKQQYDRSSWLLNSDRNSIRSAVESLFSDVRSENASEKVLIQNESEAYLSSNILARAFPERQVALLVTMMLEIPVLLMITGGSDALCQLLGRSRYHLLLGFLPLTSAISGNVGLQASTLTTRAISHSHVTADSYRPWFLREVGVSACLGLGMGSVLGTIAYFASGRDLAFGVTILIAQFVSIVTAGITGTFAPLLFSFIFKRDSGKWSGPLETAIQDIVGSFAMIVLSYHVLVLLSSGDVDPSDRCYVVDTKS